MGVRTVKTTLHFEGPSDLSVGTIRIHGEGQSVADWVATPGNLTFQTENIKPGLYATDIVPAGVAPQSVVFEVRAGEDNKVILPAFSTLSAFGSNTSYFDTRSQQTFDRLPAGLKLDLPEWPASTVDNAERSAREDLPRAESATPLRMSKQSSRISIGLSEETRGPDSFDTFRSPARMELFAGRVELDIPEDPQRDLWAARRVRLSTAIEQVRIERCLLPLYRGGTKITVSTPPFAPSDVEFNIVPVDSRARALLRALDAGTSAEAEAVCKHVVCKSLERDPSTAADPWVAMLLGLLSVRFPQIFGFIDPRWAASLAEHAGWAFDTHVIHASQILSAARDLHTTTSRHEAVAEVVSLFTRAQAAGSPYYRYTNQLFAEMAEGIAHYLEQETPQISATAVERFARVRKRWYRELPLQRGTGATFTWLARDSGALRTRRILVPNRHPSGRLPGHSTLVVFEGELSAGKISLLRGHPSRQRPAPARSELFDETKPAESPFAYEMFTSPLSWLAGAWFRRYPFFSMPLDAIGDDDESKSTERPFAAGMMTSALSDETKPAESPFAHEMFTSPLSWLVGAWLRRDFLSPMPWRGTGDDLLARRGSTLGSASPGDPNKGQFGGQSRRDGFTLDVRFESAGNPEFVTIVLTVMADAGARIGLEDYACFVLHPTFSPAEVKVPFRAGRAQLRIQAWGGFTVGVRIPTVAVVLECDLAQVNGAPQVIRTR